MPWRIYPMNQKYTKRDGTVGIYKVKNKKWVNSNKPYKPQKRGPEKSHYILGGLDFWICIIEKNSKG
jgi:hypothetical protein